MAERKGSEIIKGWPEDAREPAQLVINKYGEPHEATESFLAWLHQEEAIRKQERWPYL